MSLPTVNDVHVSAPLSNMSIAFMQDDPGISAQIFPVLGVDKQYDKYYVFDRGDANRIGIQERAPGTESEGADWRLSTDNYAAKMYALHKDIAFEERANQDSGLDIDATSVEFLTQNMKLKRDKAWATAFFTTGVWTGSTSGSDIVPSVKWDNAAATPIKDIRAQIRAVHLKTGKKPNTILFGATTWDALQDCPDLLARIQQTTTAAVTRQLVANLLEIDRVLVGELMEVTSQEGDATVVTAALFGEGALLLYVAPKPGRMTASAGYTFEWKVNGIPYAPAVRKFEMTHLNADRIEIQSAWDFKQCSPLLGVFFSDVLA